MAFTIRPVEYYYANVRDELGAAASRAVRARRARREPARVHRRAERAEPRPAHALPGRPAEALRRGAAPPASCSTGRTTRCSSRATTSSARSRGVHERLADAGVDIFASTGVTDGRGSFGYVVYVREDQFEQAQRAFEA